MDTTAPVATVALYPETDKNALLAERTICPPEVAEPDSVMLKGAEEGKDAARGMVNGFTTAPVVELISQTFTCAAADERPDEIGRAHV